MIRLYVTEPLSKDQSLLATPEQQHYLINVMRLNAGAEVLVFNGEDGEWRARLAVLGKRQAALEILEKVREQQATPDLELWIALVKRSRLETIVEKAAELGVRRVRLVLTRRTNAERVNVERLQAIAIEAAEQTGRLDAPKIIAPVKLDAMINAPQDRRLLFCDEQGDDQSKAWGGPNGRAPPALEALASLAPGAPFAVLIGPEGGFTLEERDQLRALEWVVPASLGPRILRADTAAIAAMALWQARLGDWAGLESSSS
ncbi:MAG: 16S rRNA (uracil(1498)-N(3))-methyltransferase [Pseudomonadota bacterium]|jgi:16S rRNA (uracil1498-N3)-methyltransferase